MGFSVLSVANALSPKDRASRRIAHDVAYGTVERQKLDIYAPTKTDGPLPVIFFIYGGSWNDGDRGNYEFAGRALAALGSGCSRTPGPGWTLLPRGASGHDGPGHHRVSASSCHGALKDRSSGVSAKNPGGVQLIFDTR